VAQTATFSAFLLERGAAFSAAGRVRTFLGEPVGLEVASLIPLLGTTILCAMGNDRLEFLHGQVSCEVKRLPIGGVAEGLLLSHKGHALAQLRVLRRPDDLLVVVDGGMADAVIQRLNDHIVFDQVTVRGAPLSVLSVQGAPAAAALVRAGVSVPEGMAALEGEIGGAPVLLYPARRSGPGGYDLLVPDGTEGAIFDAMMAAGAAPAGEADLDRARVLAGVATAEGEAGEGVLPQEAGLEHAVSYTKGCYLGQEIMARIEARGNLRRKLQALRLSGWPTGESRDILAGGKVVGRLGTVAEDPELGVVALAVLRNDAGEGLEVGGVRAETLPPTPA
jgi:tRNA-modifying protein YgfZ